MRVSDTEVFLSNLNLFWSSAYGYPEISAYLNFYVS